MTNMARFADSRDDNFSSTLQPLLHQPNGLLERRPNPSPDPSQGRDFNIEDPTCLLNRACISHKEKEYATHSRWAIRMKA